MKSLEALAWIEIHVIQLTVDTGSPRLFLNWATTKQIIENSRKPKIFSTRKTVRGLQKSQFSLERVENRFTLCVLGSKRAIFLIIKRRTRCITGLTGPTGTIDWFNYSEDGSKKDI